MELSRTLNEASEKKFQFFDENYFLKIRPSQYYVELCAQSLKKNTSLHDRLYRFQVLLSGLMLPSNLADDSCRIRPPERVIFLKLISVSVSTPV